MSLPSASLRFPRDRVLLPRTRLAYVHLRNLFTDAMRDRSALVFGYVCVWLPDEFLLFYMQEGEVVNVTASPDGQRFHAVAIADAIAKLNTNDESCTTHFVQAAGAAGITGPQDGPLAILAELQRRRDAAWGELSQIDGLVCPRPDATFYLFPKVTDLMARMGFDEVGAFATAALHNTGVSFCTRKHFGRPQPGETDHFVRFAYSGLSVDDIHEGLSGLRRWIESA